MGLESLVVPLADAAREVGRVLTDLPAVWLSASLQEQTKLLLTMLDAVYFVPNGPCPLW